jgi:predicted nucleic acid-binding protein
VGSTLLAEYESLLHRPELNARYWLSPDEREALLDDFLSVCLWQPVYFSWRPNLPDEADNHVLELALAGSAESIVTQNIRDFQHGELQFPHLRVLSPKNWLEEFYHDHNDR